MWPQIKFVLCFLIGISCQVSFSQDVDSGLDPSPVSKLKEARKQLKFYAEARDKRELLQLRNQLKEDFDTTQYVVLEAEEEIMINYLVNDYQWILSQVKKWSQPHHESGTYPAPPPEDRLFDVLLNITLLDSGRIIAEIESSAVENYESEFLKLYFRANLSLHPGSGITEANLSREGQSYLKQHSPSPFNPFVKRQIVRKYVKSEWGVTAGLGLARGTYRGVFGDLVKFHVPLLVNLDVDYQNWVGGFRMQVGQGRIRREFEYKGFWDRDLRVNAAYIGLYAGYSLNIKPFRIIPYYDLGLTAISVVEQERIDEDDSREIFGFTHGPGLFVDFMAPFSWNGAFGEEYKVGLRFQAGTLFNDLKNRDPRFESSYPYVGISVILHYIGTELDLN